MRLCCRERMQRARPVRRWRRRPKRRSAPASRRAGGSRCFYSSQLPSRHSHSSRRACPRTCWRSFSVAGSMRRPRSRSARCSDRRRSPRGSASLYLRDNVHPLADCALRGRDGAGGVCVACCLPGISVPTAAMFAIMFGMSNGLITIARGTVPLALFGPVGYGRLVGRIARPALVMQSIAPVTLAFVIERFSDRGALALLALFARRPRSPPSCWRIAARELALNLRLTIAVKPAINYNDSGLPLVNHNIMKIVFPKIRVNFEASEFNVLLDFCLLLGDVPRSAFAASFNDALYRVRP